MPQTPCRRLPVIFAICLLNPCALLLGSPSVPELLRETGIESGLAVHVGTTDGVLERDLAGGGLLLVHGLALDSSAMILAGDRLFLAGHVRERPGSALHAYSARDGAKLSQWDLSARPLRNGLAAAKGRIYIALEDGTLGCFAERAGAP